MNEDEDLYTKAAMEIIHLAIIGAREEGDEPLKAIERVMKICEDLNIIEKEV